MAITTGTRRCLKFHMFYVSVILLVNLLGYVNTTPFMDHYLSNRKARFNCPETTTCDCSNLFNEYEISCPLFNPKITVRVQPKAYVYVECMSIEEKDYSLIPTMTNDDITTVQIRRCPLPRGKSLTSILDKVGTTKVRTLLFQSQSNDNGLRRQHLQGLNDLQRLVLSGNGLSELPPDLFDDMTNLTWLDLKSNKVHLPPLIFSKLINLVNLEMSYNEIHNIEDNLFINQHKLQHLNLWHNKLKNLTRDVFNGISSLLDLDISSNDIETLRSNVFELLTSLRQLNLNANRFTSLPADLFKFNKNLERLKLMDNRVDLVALPNGFFANLTKLEEVMIVRTNLVELPENLFAGSPNITNITLAENAIEHLPENILADQFRLLDLDLSNNKINELHDELFRNNQELIIVKLSHNQLNNISSSIFQQLKYLRELYLNDNHITRIQQNAFATTASLSVIHLENNQLSFSESRYELETTLENIFEESPFQNLKDLQILNLRNNSITNIFRDWVFNNINLRELDLSYNNLSILYYNDLQFLSQDISVNLSHNNIYEIDLRDLETIALSQEYRDRPTSVKIYIDNNPLICNCVIFHFIKFIRNELPPITHKMLEIIPGDLECAAPEALAGKRVVDIKTYDLLCELDSPLSQLKKCPANCTCFVRPEDRGIIVNCSNLNLEAIPALPRPKAIGLDFIELHVENNSISKLPLASLPGYSDVVEIYAQNNNISKITVDNLPINLRVLELSNNKLEWLNATVFEAFNKTKTLKTLSLGSNPWSCECPSLSLLTFVQSQYKRISDLDGMRCSDGSKIAELFAGDFCKEKQELYIVLCSTIAILGLLIGAAGAMYYKYQQEIKVWLYAHNLCLWFVTEEELDKDKKYDAFISYSHKDEEFIADNLVPKLESGPNPFKLCIHVRDWLPGEFIPNQIARSVEDSRRTVVVLSPNFLESVWGRMEFRAAHRTALTEGRTRVIIIIYGDIGDIENLDPELKSYLKMNTYVKWGDPWFWNKLRYALPHSAGHMPSKSGKGLLKSAIKSSVDDKLELIKPTSVTPPQTTTPPAEIANQNPLLTKLNIIDEINHNGRKINGINGHINGAFIINTNSKQSDV